MANLLGRLQTLLFGAAIGRAASDTITPVLEPVRQHAWEQNQVRVLEPNSAARLVAQGLATMSEAESEAARNGYRPDRLHALFQLAQAAPSVAEAITMRRREQITPAQLHHAYAKAQIEPQYYAALDNLAVVLLTPSEVANAVQQGHVPNDGILPEISTAAPPAEGAVAPLTPDGRPPSHVELTQIAIPPVTEAAHAGVDTERLKVLANLAGLPPGSETLLAMWNRGLIDEATVDAGIREGHTKTKWIGAFKRMRWNVLSGQEYAEARLRDWITEEEMYAGGALTGHTKSQMDLFYKNRGRTATPRQVWLAVARKVVGPNYPGQEGRTSLTTFQDHEEAIRRSNIRPEYARMLWDIRFNYPPLFQLNRLVEAGAVDADTAALWASYNLEAPDVIAALKVYWGRATKTTSKGLTAADLTAEYEGLTMTRAAYVTALKELGYTADAAEGKVSVSDAKRRRKTRDQLIARARTQYVSWRVPRTAASDALRSAQLTIGLANEMLASWDIERELTIHTLTEPQVVKAFAKAIMSRPVAVERLTELGLAPADIDARLAL